MRAALPLLSRFGSAAFLRSRSPTLRPTRDATSSGLGPQPSTRPRSPGAKGTQALPRPAGLGEAALTEQEHQAEQAKGSRGPARGHGANAILAPGVRRAGLLIQAARHRPLALLAGEARLRQPTRREAGLTLRGGARGGA